MSTKKYVCHWCGAISTEGEWNESSKSVTDPDGGGLPDTWSMSTADGGDTVTCPVCAGDGERSEVGEHTGCVLVFTDEEGKLMLELVVTEHAMLGSGVTLDYYGAIEGYLGSMCILKVDHREGCMLLKVEK